MPGNVLPDGRTAPARSCGRISAHYVISAFPALETRPARKPGLHKCALWESVRPAAQNSFRGRCQSGQRITAHFVNSGLGISAGQSMQETPQALPGMFRLRFPALVRQLPDTARLLLDHLQKPVALILCAVPVMP
jgi:hypothetical protein